VRVATLREQPGETEGMTLPDHLDAFSAHAPGVRLDLVVAHDGPSPTGPGLRLVTTADEVRARGAELIQADLLDGEDGHAPGALARVFDRLVRR
jgi:hypothetical protein